MDVRIKKDILVIPIFSPDINDIMTGVIFNDQTTPLVKGDVVQVIGSHNLVVRKTIDVVALSPSFSYWKWHMRRNYGIPGHEQPLPPGHSSAVEAFESGNKWYVLAFGGYYGIYEGNPRDSWEAL